MMADDIAIKVSGVSKTFKLPHEKQNTLKGALINFGRTKKGYEKQQVLNNISFEIKKGEFFGIVGRNGSGKSTLLKLLAGIYAPDEGEIQINGKLTPFIELGVGFNPELSGRENVFLNGALLGFNRKEMEAMYGDIVEFAELERFMDQKLKNYSSGMQVRLAFSIAIRANTDILVLDEVLAVGDAAFQKKCNDYFERVKQSGKTIILVSHSMESVKRYCSRALLISDGHIKAIGDAEDISNQYTLDNMNAENDALSNGDGENRKLGPQVKALDIALTSPKLLSPKDTLEFEVEYELNTDMAVDIGISIVYRNVSIIEHNTKELTLPHALHMKHKISYKFPLEALNPERYEVHVAIFEKNDFKLIGFNTNSCSFVIDDRGKKRGGILSKRGQWILK